MFNLLAGVNTAHVPYQGAAQALSDVMAGQLQYLLTSSLLRCRTRKAAASAFAMDQIAAYKV
jgi:tripartite-type tricarboxylate transporter receptor subunit TctC